MNDTFSKVDDAAVGMFIVGDSIEREIDGLWFVGEVKEVFPPSNVLSECTYSVFYNDIDNLETDVPENEMRLSEKSANERSGNSLPSGKVLNNDNNDPVNNNNNNNRTNNSSNNGNTAFESKNGSFENDGTKESSQTNPPPPTKAKVVFHDQDNNDNSKLQSTGTAYVLHGNVSDRSLNTGGSGLRAIRALRKK
jgi:hypothetical protein